MLDTKYGLKYSMPHSLVHIVDNSMYTGELPTIVVDDPSLYASIVVTGCPMGADNEIISINRSDVLNVAYGMNNITVEDIEKYGQTVTYPTSMLAQDVPIKFMRVTPPEATYAFSCLLMQWRWDGKAMHVRFKTTSDNGNNGLPPGFVHSSFKNTTRLNNALVRGFLNDSVEDEEGLVWKQRVIMTVIAAGRGRIYDNYNYAVNQTQQSRRPANVRYMFSTIDTRIGQTVERFTASVINHNNVNRADYIETVNNQVSRRVKGSSILVPTINEDAVKELYTDYITRFKEMIDAGILPEASSLVTNEEETWKYINSVYKTMSVNIFDVFYGRYIYNGDVDTKLPYYQVDMFDLDIPKLERDNQIKIALDSNETISEYVENPKELYETLDKFTYGISNPDNDHHVGDIYITNKNTLSLSLITSVNQYTGSVTSVPISQVVTDESSVEKDMFRGFVSVESNTAANVAAKVKDLINRKKLIPRSNGSTEVEGVKVLTYQPDYILVEITDTKSYNGYNTFGIAKITYTPGSIEVIADNVTVTTDEASIYKMLAYPTTSVTYFTTDPASPITKNPGTTIIDITSESLGAPIVTVTGYTEDSKYVVTRKPGYSPFMVGTCPTSVSFPRNIVNTQYDMLMYVNGAPIGDSTLNITWSVNSATVTTLGTGYVVGDVITIDGIDGPKLKVTSVTSEAITVEPASDSAASSVKIVPGTYATTDTTTTEATGLKITLTTSDIEFHVPSNANPTYIQRYTVAGTCGSIYRYSADPVAIPADYYSNAYGKNLNSELGGIPVENGYAGFFDDNISTIELKWRYSELLVNAYRGKIDPRIQSPTRCSAKFLFDGGTNTIVGQTILPYITYQPIDIINASTIYTADEKEAITLDSTLIENIRDYTDIDVKQAMYDLMVYRCYQGIPEDKRPIGPGSGLSLHLDAGVTDANTAILINQSFSKRFDNPNASWDIGGYVASNGVTYTYVKRIVDGLFSHIKQYSINKPFVNKFTNIAPDEYISFFPDLDMTDWELNELLYNSGGNAWIMDVNGNLQRKYQRTLYREDGTSDLIQESNMRTLSQLVYLLQNKINTYLLDYNDDGVLKTLKDDVDNTFSNWVGSKVQALDITFERDRNPLDGGEIVVCYCNVTFRGLILRVPIIVNVQARNDSN